jgi:hypothetical protein
LLRLPLEVADVFLPRVRQALPLAAPKIERAQRELHAGRLNDPRFFNRMHGTGARWRAISELFELHCKRLGFVGRTSQPSPEITARDAAGDAVPAGPNAAADADAEGTERLVQLRLF